MDTNTVKALAALSAQTGGSFNLWALAGPRNVQARVAIMAALLGVPKVPQAKAGVTAIRAALYQAVGVSGGCIAEREDMFTAKAAAILAGGSA